MLTLTVHEQLIQARNLVDFQALYVVERDHWRCHRVLQVKPVEVRAAAELPGQGRIEEAQVRQEPALRARRLLREIQDRLGRHLELQKVRGAPSHDDKQRDRVSLVARDLHIGRAGVTPVLV